jgi:hypothetical protein
VQQKGDKQMQNVELEIRERWFPNHEAIYTEHGDLKVLDWKQKGTIAYYIRYVFDGCRMYVSGDLGEAVFCFTEKADVHIQSQYSLGYFESKLEAYSEDRRDFNSEKAVKRLREWLNELKESGVEYDHDEMRELFEETRDCSSKEHWCHIVNSHDFISDLDPDYWEWMYDIGDEIPLRIQAYLIGLKMASEQLRKTNVA